MTAEKKQPNENTKDRFANATGRSIGEWMEYLQSHPDGGVNLHDLTHQDFARLAIEGGASEWWAQSISVEVERIIGRRRVGQTVTGSVSAGASKTVRGEWTEAFDSFVAFLSAGGRDLLPAEPLDEPRISETEKWRYWRAGLTDGSTVAIDCSDASTGEVRKTRLSVKHDKLGSLEQRDAIKAHWRGVLDEFAEEVAG
ncbi:hypothetical protein [Corynebacterium halotolerans]|uniref:Uncharacterized protein n=1 Tax=Corynebacterium halotolerans YIM 70093 = DSM 44683 TaxID=1121362 RepID=M1P1U3_9CORY|nr:hypothetical protein [Corynebacterium halotolerans]AGF73785.1 hypothetical protein A605_13945 [Corynebacterium halotolerans YIM 70093 = DSM 44683]